MRILVLGASCIDIIGCSDKRIISYSSNKGIVKIFQSGCARNISEYLSRIGINVKFLTAVGDDVFGQNLLLNLAQLGIDISCCLILKNVHTSTNLKLIDADGDGFASVNSDNISYMIDINHIKNSVNYMPDILYIDDNLNNESILYAANYINADIKIFGPVNIKIHNDILNILDKFDVLILNKMQAENLWGRLIATVEDAKKCAEYIVENKKIKKVFILLDELGSIAAAAEDAVHILAYEAEHKNTRQSECAYSAGIIFSLANDFSLYRSALFSEACRAHANNLHDCQDKFSLEEILKILSYGKKINAKIQE